MKVIVVNNTQKETRITVEDRQTFQLPFTTSGQEMDQVHFPVQ